MYRPNYIRLHESGVLSERIDGALALLSRCTVCPRKCGVNRLAGETKVCKTGRYSRIASYGPHFGEELPLVGRGGSGTIFFASCNLGCLFCQNADISHRASGEEVSPWRLAEIMLELQQMGCHNINLVTPTHVTPQILEALPSALEGGLHLPLVYNCGGYESVETLRLLDGVVDIYMPDYKYSDSEPARTYSGAKDYPEKVKTSLKEMHRQVGDLLLDKKGIAFKGLLVRHLIMPEGLAGTEKAMKFISNEISPHTYVNVMNQYRPCNEAVRHPSSASLARINRRVTIAEHQEAVDMARRAGLERLDGYWSDINNIEGGDDHGHDDNKRMYCLRGL